MFINAINVQDRKEAYSATMIQHHSLQVDYSL